MKNKINILLQDNQWYANAYQFVSDNQELKEKQLYSSWWDDIRKLRDINNQISEGSLVTIPRRDKNFDNKDIFTRNNDKLFTNNWVGVISTEGSGNETYRIEIRSRFDGGSRQFFLLYLLCTVYGFNIHDSGINSNNDSDYIFMLIILFLNSLKEAFSDGLYKEYVRKEYNDFSFRGSLDVNRNIKYNVPFLGRTAYSVREYSYDSEVLCLIRQTLEYINDCHSDLLEGYTGESSIIQEIEDVIENATPSYGVSKDYAESIKCQREITHPLFQKYEAVRKLSLMILRESGQNIFDDSDDDSAGLLVDVSWLWEEFIAVKLLDAKRYRHLLTDGSEGSLNWAENRRWYPDYIEDLYDDQPRRVLDAKYKDWNYNRDDVHQLLSYMYLTGGKMCGIIYPEDEACEFDSIQLSPFRGFYKNDDEVTLWRLPLFVPNSEKYDNYDDYCKKMNESISKWKMNNPVLM